jgi:putative transposase
MGVQIQNVLVKTEEQLLHLSRYIHLNPTSASLVKKVGDWAFSSYKEYLLQAKDAEKICKYNDLLNIQPRNYEQFVEARLDYQRELSKIKNLILE